MKLAQVVAFGAPPRCGSQGTSHYRFKALLEALDVTPVEEEEEEEEGGVEMVRVRNGTNKKNAQSASSPPKALRR